MKRVKKTVVVPAVVIAVLSVASPAFAIHHSIVPAGDCAKSHSQAVGLPATGKANLGVSNSVLGGLNLPDPPPCANAPND